MRVGEFHLAKEKARHETGDCLMHLAWNRGTGFGCAVLPNVLPI
jgi:hypothetical protein